MLKILILTTLKKFKSPKLVEFIQHFELNDPFEIFIEDEVQLVAKGCLASYYKVQALNQADEKKFARNLIDHASNVSELFSKVDVLERGLLLRCGKDKEDEDDMFAMRQDGFMFGSESKNNEQQ